MVFFPQVLVKGNHVRHTAEAIESEFKYVHTDVDADVTGEEAVAKTRVETFHFRTIKKVPKIGVMLVGWGGNNGSTLTAAIIANRENISWNTRTGEQSPNYFGSMLMSSTTRVGMLSNREDAFAPMHSLLPMVHPNDIIFGGWDTNSANLAHAMERAQVLDYELQRKVAPHMKSLLPLPSVYYEGFVASNQEKRANNVIPGKDKAVHLEKIRGDIRRFKSVNNLDKVIVLWTATTERFSEIMAGVNDTARNLLNAIQTSHPEVSPSTLFATAAILEGSPYINGSPQNTFVPGCIELAEREHVFIAGDDFKTGQTKFKSVMVDFLISAGIKPRSIVSYNHLGNNDGANLSAPTQFRSKEISKSNIVEDMVACNQILYRKGEHPDHEIVIKYVPYVGDSKRALDEYTSEIFMGGSNTIVTHNTCEDSLLAAPLILDLVILCELSCRMWYKVSDMKAYEHFHPVLSWLSYMLKAPVVPENVPVVNALFKQRACIENLLRVFAGLPVEDNMRLEHRFFMYQKNDAADSGE